MSLDPKNVQKFFAQAIEISDPQQRHAFLAERCAGDAELFRRVSELLTAFDQPKQYLNQPTVFRDNGLDADRKGQQPGSIIAGRYKLLEAIAEGGMGTVWVAEQIKPVRRKVAIKLIKPGMDSRQVLARFDAERQALALMDHPNIAKVFDGGVTDQGRPFFAMEYVKGMPLTEYCDQMRLSLAERLKLFIPICQAVQHAHQKGIIHRDLKPSNVLICLYDGKPVPKVIDFGLAKAMYQPLTEQTLHTGHGLMLGTPLYMSPEQAEHNNLDVDTRTDVYSLGVMLYELLTGTTPLEKAQMKDAAFGEILRLIKEVEPPKPSTRVSTNAQRASIAAQRSLDPEQLGRSIRGDLDWIIMKALDKERDRRYETANGLARDIERFLSHEAVEACPPSTIYRLQKQFQKHRTSISTAAAFLLLLCAGAVISMWQAVRATNAEQVAVKARDEAIVNEGLANVAKTAESTARVAEEQARAAESEQRGVALTQKAEAETQRTEAEKQRDEAQRLQQEAIARSAQLEKLTEEQRRAIYASDMNLVRLESLRGNLPRMREILYAQLPIDRADLRGFEWNYWYRYLTQAKVLRHFDNFRGVGDDASLPVIFRPVNYTSHPVILRGAKIAAVPKGPSTTLVKLESGEVLQTIPNAIGALMARARFAANGRSVFGGYSSQSAFSPPPQLTETGTSPLQGSLRPEGFVVYDPNAEPRTWTYPADTFSHISFLNISEDGRFVGALGNDVTHVHGQPACRILIWNIDTQKLVLDHLENRLLNRFVFNEDGSRIAAFYCHGPMTLSNELRDVVVALDVAEGKVLGVARHNDDIDTANWLPDGRRLVLTTLSRSGNQQKEILSWELESQQPRRLSGELMPNYVITATSPDGRLVAVSSHSTSSIRLIDTTTGSVVRTLHNEASNIESMDFSLNGTQLTAFCASGDVVQWTVIPDDDRFALRSRPLPTSTTSTTEGSVSWKFSEKQDRLAFGNRSTFLSVRDADGRELFHRETDEPRTPSSAAPKLHFDQEGNLLAVMDAKPGSGNIELIDLKESKVRWNVQLGNSPDSSMQMEFTNDHSSLIVSYFSSTYRIDVQTGEFKEIPVSSEQGSLSVFQLCRSENSEKLFAVGYATTSKSVALEIRDAVTGETLRSVPLDPSRDMRQRRGEDRAIASPNGESIAHSKNGFIELWDMTTQQMVFNSNGIDCVFSTDGRSLVVTTSTRNSAYKQIGVGNTGTAGAVDGAQIVSATNGRIITEFSFAGDPADEVRLSFDGSRLLSLHGKRPSADISRPAQARLWDCASGREILDLPIAPECEFFWDLQLSPTGDSLTGVILSRHRGNATGGRSFVFDATPLSPEADAQLVAANWFRKLKQTTPVRQQMVDTIDANRTSVPLVRQITLELASHVPFDADKVASQCMGVIEGTDHEMVMVERALSWARTLEKSEPGSLRAISLISAAQYRLGQAESALQTLQQADKNFTAGDTSNLKWEHLRRAVEVLCLHRLSKDPIIAHRKAIELVDFMQDAYMTNTTYAIEESISWSRTMREVLLIQGEAFFFQQARPRYRPALVAAQAAQLTDDRAFNVKNAEVVFRLADANGDQVISNIEFPSQKEWETFGSFKMEREFGVSGMGLRNFHLPGLLKEWERFARFDRDGIAGLSLSEWTAGNLLLAATAEATPPRGVVSILSMKGLLSMKDTNKDGRITVDDYPEDARKSFRKADTDQNGELSPEEYLSDQARITFDRAFKQALVDTLNKRKPQAPPGIRLLTLNAALEDLPGDVNFLNERAWILATCADDSVRNGDQAVQDAIQACEVWKYRQPNLLDTLAAAYAEKGDFEKAVQNAEKACSLVGSVVGSVGADAAAMKERLELFKQQKPYRDASAAAGASGSEAKEKPQPLIPTTHVNASRRIRGGEPCWTADGQRLIYSLTGFSPDASYFESLDLITGETKILCRGGTRPVCSPVDGTIAFERNAGNRTAQIWLVDADGRNERKLSDGHRPHWTLDGNLCYTRDAQLVCISHNRPDELLWSRKAPVSERFNLAFSPDGTRVAWSSFGKWNVFSVPDTAELPRPAFTPFDYGRSHWSPDGRRIAFNATNDNTPGVWLFDLESQETRLLADIAAIPRWSPDGKTLALGLQSSNEILLLDVTSLKRPGAHE